MSTTMTVKEIAKDYAPYLKMDLSKQTRSIHDAVEDMQMRLEEFESIIRMIQSENEKCINQYIPTFRMMCPKIMELCKKVDLLERIVLRINYDLTDLEKDFENAEADLGSAEKRFTILNPLTFFKKSGEPVAPQRIPTEFHPPRIFQTDEYFESQ
ncbi:uncharacterized protein LOC122511657 [Leptopilina heterotoma]|uniref:uncharacterized protein LOC122511657 n=1 Tax=Leptopilina heterotoma TaxID=63436 RepID=UPI001CAA0B9A|nr:uncharacterized protein LOC122511657 [Leptopilina heterotoma]XP_043483000.1 uncharacterized protein LOC122511657 [Leptopilina heterotoma]XP_043483007.1 uncharacterized protein LOC122511657 [Leptopilina heterotoma]